MDDKPPLWRDIATRFNIPRNSYTLISPSFHQLQETLERLKDHIADHPCPSQYLLVTNIAQDLFRRLEENADLFRGVRATVAHHKACVLYKIIVNCQHDHMSMGFRMCLSECLSKMELNLFNGDFTFGRGGRCPGHYISKEPDFSFFSLPQNQDRGNALSHSGSRRQRSSGPA